jgi:hypothetical protein
MRGDINSRSSGYSSDSFPKMPSLYKASTGKLPHVGVDVPWRGETIIVIDSLLLARLHYWTFGHNQIRFIKYSLYSLPDFPFLFVFIIYCIHSRYLVRMPGCDIVICDCKTSYLELPNIMSNHGGMVPSPNTIAVLDYRRKFFLHTLKRFNLLIFSRIFQLLPAISKK